MRWPGTVTEGSSGAQTTRLARAKAQVVSKLLGFLGLLGKGRYRETHSKIRAPCGSGSVHPGNLGHGGTRMMSGSQVGCFQS